MNRILTFSIILLILSCKKTTEDKKDGNPFVNKNYFSVSEYDRKADSTRINFVNDSLQILDNIIDKRFNADYSLGAIHFLIEDNEKSYYVVKDLEPFILMCGNVDPMSKRDSINSIIKIIQKAKPIATSAIEKLLYEHREKIVNNKSNIPLQISFALKDDSLKGQMMYNIIRFMDDSKMYIYTIRRMNKDEIFFIKNNSVKR